MTSKIEKSSFGNWRGNTRRWFLRVIGLTAAATVVDRKATGVAGPTVDAVTGTVSAEAVEDTETGSQPPKTRWIGHC
jgi:hypothetical protein